MAKRKCTPKLIARVREALEAGNYAKTVQALVGVSHDAWYRWLREGKKEDTEKAAAEAAGEVYKTSDYHAFYEAVKNAEATAESKAIEGILAAGQDPKHWTALAWFLERKFPDRWKLNRAPEEENRKDPIRDLISQLRGDKAGKAENGTS